MPLTFVIADDATIPLHLLTPEDLDAWCAAQDASVGDWIARHGFTAAAGEALLCPASGGPVAVAGWGSPAQRVRGRFHLARAAQALPAGSYALQSGAVVDALAPEQLSAEALGWLLGGYGFDRYRAQTVPQARLVAPEGVDAARLEAIAAGEALTRDLINTPAADMGPEALEAAARALATEFGAAIEATVGGDLLERNFPMIHAVGRAAAQAPRLLDLRWGTAGPKLTLVGKGVCFDTGGLNLKSGASMGLMKKDMGGAAAVLGLARMIMALNLPLQLRVLVPAVENSVSANSFRPQDILTSRKGLTVEINNTDAEGRLVLADALALADEERPDLLISMATLTGAARVAVGPDLSPYFTGDEMLAAALESGAVAAADPVWRMPFHDPYETMIEPGIADLDNAPKGGFAGAITAALFLRRFVTDSPSYTHFDIYGWNPTAAPGRTKGGAGMATRALLEALPQVLSL
ncbi:leucyl aminopeptidase [Pacificitalea manganoxidans]|uniref:Leucyl aminopeptidase n=1 Tax=Pacificitalea manganoxidans TaxID=1411902 RepID=A0A291M2J3_9RHOB|nr:leucyl aminopeptidase family protein [Pacificitalea manganoxidans]ATI43191.1 leucyl aminopeptidase [Pacificitalea manganoxidans]MDR6306865.1 leucyl aminopeptidase [Pacificitalea manganoxidans]